MSVFLRWGIFGILGVAGLMYAYNASKQMARKKQARPVPVVSANDGAATDTGQGVAAADSGHGAVTPACEEELLVARVGNESAPRRRTARSSAAHPGDRISIGPETSRAARNRGTEVVRMRLAQNLGAAALHDAAHERLLAIQSGAMKR